jgi:Flp pilus assembly pilin Flp
MTPPTCRIQQNCSFAARQDFGTTLADTDRVAALLDPVRLAATDSKRTVMAQRSLIRDRRGAIPTEYVVLVGTMGLAVVFALVTVGPKLVKDFQRARNVTAAPIP